MDSREIKRQILMQSEETGIRKNVLKNYEEGRDNGLTIEIGEAFESMVQTKGWAFLEAYIIGNANPVARLFDNSSSELERGKAHALITLMQHVDQIIRSKNDILEMENRKREDAASKKPDDTEN